MARTGGYRRSAVWRPCGVTPHAALQNKSVVCSGSRVTISTVMKLHGSDNWGGIKVKTYTKSTCSHPPYSGGGDSSVGLEHRTRDWKVAGSNPCWNGGRIFFSRVDFLCWLLFRYPFHPRVTTVARKKSRSFCQKSYHLNSKLRSWFQKPFCPYNKSVWH